MERPLQEGDVVAEQYLLDSRISTDLSNERWISSRQQTGDRVCLTFLRVDDETWTAISDRVSRLQGLLHENILVPTLTDSDNEHRFVVEPFVQGYSTLDDMNSIDKWRVIRQLLRAFEYCHSLGIVHGDFHPGNILVNESGGVKVTGFASSKPSTNNGPNDYISPQVASGADPDITDDLYSLGQTIFEILTGKTWSADVELNTPLPNVPAQMLKQMLSPASLDRQVNLSELSDALALHFERKDQGIESTTFSRPIETSADLPVTATPTKTSDGFPVATVLAALIAVMILGIGLIALIPDDQPTAPVAQSIPSPSTESGSPSAAPTRPAQPPVPTMTPLEAARMEHLKAEGERLGRDILKLQIQLEDNGIALWAGPEYNQLTEKLDSADVVYREARFDDAFSLYEEVLTALQALIDRIPDELSRQTELGDLALTEGDAEAALTAFTIATMLAPEDETLSAGLERAENLEEVVRITQGAEIHERNGDLEQAGEQYTLAVSLDRLWTPATEGLQRTKEAILQRNFQRAMSKGFQGIASKNYVAAREGFEAAGKILPASNEPADGLLQVEQAERNDRIERLRRIADGSIEQSDWQTALAAYNDALAISPSLAFAINGKAEIEERIELERAVSQFLSDPTLLQGDAGYSEAAALIRDASRIENPTTHFQRQINTLAQLVSAARIELPVTIESNGSTDVTVRKYKQLGQISSETIYLIPGKYVIVGERPGYRDVRQELILLPGQPTPTVVVASDERVR